MRTAIAHVRILSPRRGSGHPAAGAPRYNAPAMAGVSSVGYAVEHCSGHIELEGRELVYGRGICRRRPKNPT